MIVVILAVGMGNRLGEKSGFKPEPALEIGSQPIQLVSPFPEVYRGNWGSLGGHNMSYEEFI